MKILSIFFAGHHKIGLYIEVISIHLSVKYLFRVLEIPDMFWGVNGRWWAGARTFRPRTFRPRTFRPRKMPKVDVSAITINCGFGMCACINV